VTVFEKIEKCLAAPMGAPAIVKPHRKKKSLTFGEFVAGAATGSNPHSLIQRT
jgi:hypothetical protein